MTLRKVAFWLGKLFGQAFGLKPKPTTHLNEPTRINLGGITTHATHDSDTWEGAFYDAHEQRSIKKTIKMDYCDANNNLTERVVTIRAYEPENKNGLIIGRCHLRNATRTFKFSRMQNVVDMDTGEMIRNLQQHLNDEWAASPAPVMDKLYNTHNDVLKLLFYMAKADGSVRLAELNVIAKCCAEITHEPRIDVAMVKDMLQYVDVPTMHTFTRVYNKLRRENPAAAQKAADACRAIVATQKSVHFNEQAALNILDKPLLQPKKEPTLHEQTT